ncbi:MAG: Coenzyme F420 hydrogenase/dehydrogenase, beta subunit C-terminal domain [Bacteroidales bacterium]
MSATSIEKKLRRVMRSELCNRCGTCVGLSEGAIVFGDKQGAYRPELRSRLHPGQVERIWNACSGHSFSFPAHREALFPDAPHVHPYTGAYRNLSIGHAVDEGIRSAGASGGILSAVLLYLLETGRIDGAVTTRMSETVPWEAETFIATTREEILGAAQSKYILTSVNEILAQTAAFPGRLAYVGLPGQVQSVRKLQQAGDPSVRNIDWVFGPFYGNTLHFSSVKSFLRSYGERAYRNIRRLDFRYGEWPGSMRIEMASGRVIELRKFHANYLIPFHIVRNSLYCTDFSNEFTDLSGGDAWAPVYEERGKGYSLVVTRSARGQALVEEMQREGWLSLEPIGEKEAIEMHSHGYDFKKRGAFLRIRLRRLFGKAIPDYGYAPGAIPFRRVLMEGIISGLFLLAGTRFASFLVEQLPPDTLGRLFEKTRTRWKRSTRDIKRKDLVS